MQTPRRSRQRLPLPLADRLEQQHLAARSLDWDPRRDDPRVVHDRQPADEIRQLAEHAVRHLAPRARGDEQPRRVAPLRRLLTEGWRSLNARLDRIEAALEQPKNVVPLRGNVA